MEGGPESFPTGKCTWKHDARGKKYPNLAVFSLKIKINFVLLFFFFERFPNFYLPKLLLIVLALTIIFFIFKRPFLFSERVYKKFCKSAK